VWFQILRSIPHSYFLLHSKYKYKTPNFQAFNIKLSLNLTVQYIRHYIVVVYIRTDPYGVKIQQKIHISKLF
jgi:hypothetical protein